MLSKDKVFGKRLKSLRSKNDKNQEDVANDIGISRARYSHYENDHVEPDMDMINKLADYYNVTVDYLLGRSDYPNLTEKQDQELNEETMKYYKMIEDLPEEKRRVVKEMLEAYAKNTHAKKED